MCALPDFQTVEQRHKYFEENAENYVACCRVSGMTYRSEHRTLHDARATATAAAKLLNRAVMIYGVLGGCYDQWLENVSP